MLYIYARFDKITGTEASKITPVYLHNEELHSLYCSSNTVTVISSRRLRWAGHPARMEKGGSVFIILTVKPTREETFRKD